MKKKRIAIIIIMLLTICVFKITYAENLDDLRAEKEQIKEDLNTANSDLENVQIELTENLTAISQLDLQIENGEEELEKIKTKLEKIKKEISEIKSKLDDMETLYNNQKEICQNRLVALYEMGPTTYLDVLLNSKNITEFISNYYLIGEIAEFDNDLLDNISREKSIIEEINRQLEDKNEGLKAEEKSQEKKIIALQNVKTIRNSYLNSLTEEEQKLKEQVTEYQNKLDDIDSQILYLTIGEIDENYVGGEFLWPSPGYTTITSPFGVRFHPILKYYKKHCGIDIAVPMGTYIRAANSGVVTTSSYLSTAGNAVIIDHGGGVCTLYAHASELLVNVGDKVQRGDIIMKSGSTGLSTGPHLHFAISINGQYVDPMPYLLKNNEQ